MVFSIIVCWMVHSYITLGIFPTCFSITALDMSPVMHSVAYRVVYFHSSDLCALGVVRRWIFLLQTVKKKKKVKKSFSGNERTPKQKRPFFNSFLKPSSTIASAVIDNPSILVYSESTYTTSPFGFVTFWSPTPKLLMIEKCGFFRWMTETQAHIVMGVWFNLELLSSLSVAKNASFNAVFGLFVLSQQQKLIFRQYYSITLFNNHLASKLMRLFIFRIFFFRVGGPKRWKNWSFCE